MLVESRKRPLRGFISVSCLQRYVKIKKNSRLWREFHIDFICFYSIGRTFTPIERFLTFVEPL
jgi:hypothetical protein